MVVKPGQMWVRKDGPLVLATVLYFVSGPDHTYVRLKTEEGEREIREDYLRDRYQMVHSSLVRTTWDRLLEEGL